MTNRKMADGAEKTTRETSGIRYACKYSRLVEPERLNEHPRNNMKHPSSQVKALAKVIAKIGWRHPIIVSSRSGFIVAGHARKEAAKLLGCHAPVDYQDFANEEEELAFLVLDNAIPELAEIDSELLALNVGTLEESDFELSSIFESPAEMRERTKLTTATKTVRDVFITASIPLDRIQDAEAALTILRRIEGAQVDVEAH